MHVNPLFILSVILSFLCIVLSLWAPLHVFMIGEVEPPSGSLFEINGLTWIGLDWIIIIINTTIPQTIDIAFIFRQFTLIFHATFLAQAFGLFRTICSEIFLFIYFILFYTYFIPHYILYRVHSPRNSQKRTDIGKYHILRESYIQDSELPYSAFYDPIYTWYILRNVYLKHLYS